MVVYTQPEFAGIFDYEKDEEHYYVSFTDYSTIEGFADLNITSPHRDYTFPGTKLPDHPNRPYVQWSGRAPQ